MATRTPRQTGPLRKKSVSKSPADKGRKESRAVQAERQKEGRSQAAKGNAAALAEAYEEREHHVRRRPQKKSFDRRKAK